MKIRDFLFNGFEGCTNHGCIVREVKGMGTNGQCKCLLNLSRSQLLMLQSRLAYIANVEIEVKS